MRKPIIVCFILVTGSAIAEEEPQIWNGFSFTPGVGLRHLGLDVTRKSDGYTGNIAQDVPAKVFITLNIESPKFHFGNSPWGISIVNVNSFVTLDHQWYNYDPANTGVGSGERVDVGSEISGRYSYLLPQLFYESGQPGGGSYKVALGYGLWNADLSGTIKLTPNNQPTSLTPSSNVDLNTTKMGYLFTMSYRTASYWLWEMSIGGINFSDPTYKYEIEEVTLSIGKTFMF